MVILLFKIFNEKHQENKTIQEIYDEKVTSKVSCHSIKCPCCGSYNIIKKGSYARNLLIFGKIEILRIHRIKCEDCGRTHAIFSVEIIPYCYIDAISALKFLRNEKVDIGNELILAEFLRNMKKRRTYLLRQYLNEFGICIENDSLEEIDSVILKAEKKLFLQIHRGNVYEINVST